MLRADESERLSQLTGPREIRRIELALVSPHGTRHTVDSVLAGPSGGRTWWAHFEFTRINIELIILPKEIEDVREVGASTSPAMQLRASYSFASPATRFAHWRKRW